VRPEGARPQPTATAPSSLDPRTSESDAASEADAKRSPDATNGADFADEVDEESAAEESHAVHLRPPLANFAWLGAEAQATPIFGVGGSLLFQAILGEWLAWSSAFSVAHGSTNIDRGSLSVLAVSLRTGVAFALRGRQGSLHLGAGLRGQWQRLEGEPSDGDLTESASFSAWSLGPAAFAGATWQFAPPAFLALELEASRLREMRAQVEGGNAKTLSAWRASAVVGAGIGW
jgi:hypothetical protein